MENPVKTEEHERGVPATDDDLRTLQHHDEGTVDALDVLERERAKWESHRDLCVLKQDEYGSALASKIQSLCQILASLVNEDVHLTSRQAFLVTQAIHSVAARTELEVFEDEGDLVSIGLGVATFINTCRQ
jgi:hypothetical protein